MEVVLFCRNSYSFSILRPLEQEALSRGCRIIWYVKPQIISRFPFGSSECTSSLDELKGIRSDAVLTSENRIPYFLHGVKGQVFHGFAGEKKGHFRIRGFFDIYFTQGPFFTRKFEKLKNKYGNFEVIETGWPRLDVIFGSTTDLSGFIKKYGISSQSKTVLYAPTFSPKLTSSKILIDEIATMERIEGLRCIVKFHPLMAQAVVKEYKHRFAGSEKIVIADEDDILPLILISDLLLSDTSSVVYEYLLLDKPVVTFRTTVRDPQWTDITNVGDVMQGIMNSLQSPSDKSSNEIRKNYHPYTDGKSSARILNALEAYIRRNGVPDYRKLSFFRRVNAHKYFGKP